MDFLKLARVMGIGGNHQLYNVLGELSVGFFIAELDLLSIMQKMHNLKIFQYGSNIPIIDVDNNQLIDTDKKTDSEKRNNKEAGSSLILMCQFLSSMKDGSVTSRIKGLLECEPRIRDLETFAESTYAEAYK